jgi:hypothetical protein
MTIRQFAVKHREEYNPAYVALTKNDNSYLGTVTPPQLRKIRRENWESAIVNDMSMQHVRAVRMEEPLYEVIE